MVAGINGASNGPNKKKTRNYDSRTGDLAKTPTQVYKTQQLNKIKELTKEGKHKEAQKLYNQVFPKA